ncbi:hypothetical protein ALC56_05335 [Trachymyrmex septentrionalis]|uniref:Uncharacterized protein n=1 Tax=Trachymyrmex septentrionalis TaxID=34720 RepID=A0A195FI90_9HYME|nr:hypothetical protein ALC56_05335 [Trachymyrmex septentrionalis]
MTNAIMFVRGVEDSLAEEGFKAKTLLCEYRVMRHKLPTSCSINSGRKFCFQRQNKRD